MGTAEWAPAPFKKLSGFSGYLPEIFIAQRLPHIVHTSVSIGGLDSLKAFAVAGSIESLICSSQLRAFLFLLISISRSIAPGIFFAISPAWAAIFEAITPILTSSTVGSLRCSVGGT